MGREWKGIGEAHKLTCCVLPFLLFLCLGLCVNEGGEDKQGLCWSGHKEIWETACDCTRVAAGDYTEGV